MKKLYNTLEEKNAARRQRRAAKSQTKYKEKHILRIPFSDCWFWIGSYWPSGYGYIRYTENGKIRHQPAHRYIYELYKEKIPKELDACHTCDNPSCVNPEHIWPGTPSDNMKDAYRKGRRTAKGIHNGNYRHGKYDTNKDLR